MSPSVTRLRLAIQCHWNGTQQELSVACGFCNATLSDYVRGNKPMLRTHRAILSHLLRVEPDEIDGWIAGNELWEKLSA